MTKNLLWILWPSFVVAGAADGLLFSMFDPHELHAFGEPVEISRLGAYTLGFLFLWFISAVACAFSLWLSTERRSPGS